MRKKLYMLLLAIALGLLVIFATTYFNQQRYYDVQENNRLESFKALLMLQQKMNQACLKRASKDECYQEFVGSMSAVNLRGNTLIAEASKGITHQWSREGHRDDRLPVQYQHTFTEFDSRPTVTLSKLTRHRNEVLYSLNVMFFSVGDWAEYAVSQIKGQPSTFGKMSAPEFSKYVAWPRWYPNLPMFIVVMFLILASMWVMLKMHKLNADIHIKDKQIADKNTQIESVEQGIQDSMAQIQQHQRKISEIKHRHNSLMAKSQQMKTGFINLLNKQKHEALEKFQQLEMEKKQLIQTNAQRVEALQKLNVQKLALMNDQQQQSETLKQLGQEREQLLHELNSEKHLSIELHDQLSEKLLQVEKNHAQVKESAQITLNDLLIKEQELKASNKENQLLDEKMRALMKDLALAEEHSKHIHEKLSLKEQELETTKKKNETLERQVLDEENNYLEELAFWEQEAERLDKQNHDQQNLIKQLEAEKLQLEHQKEESVMNLSGNRKKPAKLLDMLLKNVEVNQGGFSYASPEHHSRDFVTKVHKSLKQIKEPACSGLIEELRGTEFEPKLRGCLKVVQNHGGVVHARKGWGVIAYDNGDAGYAAYMHLTVKEAADAVLAAKAIQQHCSIFKKYVIKLPSKLDS